MTYVVVESCIKCKYMDCVEVCPVDCFYEGENMLVIHPDECIDCGVCEPECPIEAIKPDTEPGLERFLGLNAEFAVTMNPSRLNHRITEVDWNPLSSLTPKAWSGGNAIPQPTPHPGV